MIFVTNYVISTYILDVTVDYLFFTFYVSNSKVLFSDQT